MTQNIFQYDNMNNRIELNVPEILLVREFAELIECKRNICKEDSKGTKGLRAFREFTYIWLALDWKSPYSDYPEQERHQEALKDAKMTEEEFNNPEFRAACRKYRELQDSNRSIRMLHAAESTVDSFIDYFENVVDLAERDINGKPAFKTKDIIAEISSLSTVYEELKTLEGQVKKEMMETTNIRGGATDGFLPNFD